MRLLRHIAQRIVNEVSKVIEEEVIVMNDEGVIIAASDSSRVGSFHQVGKEVVLHGKKQMITEGDSKKYKGVKMGLNLPIHFQRNVIGVIGITGSHPTTVRYGELIQRMTELIIQEAFAAERLDSKLRGLETFVYEWLHAKTLSEEFIERGEILGIQMNEPRYCVLVQLDEESKELNETLLEQDMIQRVRALLPNEEKDILVRWGNGRFVLLVSAKVHTEKELYHALERLHKGLEKTHSIRCRSGISRVHHDPVSFSTAYHEAKQALNVKMKEETVIFYQSLTLEIALTEVSSGTRKKLITEVLGKLLDEPELLETLEVYLNHQLSVKEAAKSLHIHINTLHYRLKRIQDLSGCHLKETKELVTLFLALWYYRTLDE
ncbi:helix-turn-helix domain-containing protein [Alkalihalobacillus sp. MEB130]|uniref:CdaR family transcriptional regulator n=1 Tax=Alkalihalobacillus sp. MEB130 TaxID=2976704 RepID=UPI0028DD4422|nr:sugar diacid recognition domain-containing protein [Alkalihalobacillus sp. MEB130]MDT8861454.1 helix-turn-helix domain-containing protein [Alkalihalobacillus sp. MEB130]